MPTTSYFIWRLSVKFANSTRGLERDTLQRISPEEVKQIELDILLEFDRICKTHGLTYLLFFGTALGAARHGGFIPWDDDIDVAMPRNDYEKLYELFSSGRISSRYELITCRDRSSTYSFFKLIDSSTQVIETYLRSEFSIGIWIDIFPLEGISKEDNYVPVWKRCHRKLFLKAQSVANPKVGRSFASCVIKKLICPFARTLDPYKLAMEIERDAMSLNHSSDESIHFDPDYWISFDALSLSKACYPAEMLFPATSVQFEGQWLPAPNNIGAYLAFEYGDWRRFPPENERLGHFPEAYRC